MAESQHAEAGKQASPERAESAHESSSTELGAPLRRAAAPMFQGGRIDPRGLTPQVILALQRTAGNAAVSGLLRRYSLEQAADIPARPVGTREDEKQPVEAFYASASAPREQDMLGKDPQFTPTTIRSSDPPTVQRLIDGAALRARAGEPKQAKVIKVGPVQLGTKNMSGKYQAVIRALDNYRDVVKHNQIEGHGQDLFRATVKAALGPVEKTCNAYISGHKKGDRTLYIKNIVQHYIPEEIIAVESLCTDSTWWGHFVGHTYERAIADTQDQTSRNTLTAEKYTVDRMFMDWRPKPMPRQGWKLHVSADAHSAATVGKTVLPILRKLSINHKVVESPNYGLEQMAATPGQAGKYVTIYPDDDAHAKQIVAVLNDCLQGLAPGPPIPGEKPLGSSGMVFARYGGFVGPTIERIHLDGTRETVQDERGKIKPDWVPDLV